MATSTLTVGLLVSLAATGLGLAVAAKGAPPEPAAPPAIAFAAASIRLERNLTDTDGEAVITVRAGDQPLKDLSVVGPDQRTVLELAAPGRLGAGELVFETAEPAFNELLNAYPAGRYHFTGHDTAGRELSSYATVSQAFIRAPLITYPANGSIHVTTSKLIVHWNPVPGATGYVVELEADKAGLATTIDIPRNVTAFAPPDGWLLPGDSYTLGVGSVAASGNRTVTEIRFTTVEKAPATSGASARP
ncbi:MAG: hypothetical protein ABI661_00690 [Gammaproteobacteria bacterium]